MNTVVNKVQRPTPSRSLECWTVIGGDTREAVFHVSDYSVLVDPTVTKNKDFHYPCL